MNRITAVIAAACIAMSGSAIAQTKVNPPSGELKTGSGGELNSLFGELDVNHDGRVSKEEAKGNGELTSSWSRLDADKDMYLTEKEYAKWKAPISGAHNGTPAAGAGSKPAH